jgi:predicted ATPase
MDDNPSGTVTFLFTDIEGSTERWQHDDEAMSGALAAHDQTIRAVVDRHGGSVFKHTGDGLCAVFASAPSAVTAAVEAQAGLELPVRMGVHTGEAESRDGDYFGPTLNLTARVMDAGHGGQVLVSSATAGLIRDRALVDLGEHRLKGLDRLERIFQVGDGAFPALRSLARLDHNMPAQRTEFIGRVEELEALTDLLRERSLVTVTAVGGAGKTRLALQAGAAAGDELFDAVCFVDLSTIDVPELVESEIGAGVGMPTGFGLVAFLAEWKGLLILDNCEHLIDACAEIVDELLAGCPGITILATSRESLDVDGEQVFPLGSLDPATDGVVLFMSRARLLDPSFDLDAAERSTVVEICARLDGLPLAIELAAGQSRHLAPAELFANLGDRMTLLAGGRRRIGRQRTLEGAIDWSYELLDEPDRLLLRRLSIFLGAVSVEEIVSVCADERLSADDVVVRLHRLVDRNLVVSRPGEVVTLYSLLETIRVYAHDRLVAADEQQSMRDRHLAAYLERSELMLASGGSIAPEHFAFQLLNAAGAMDYAFDSGQDRPAVQLYALWGGLAEDGSDLWSERRERAGAAAERLGDWASAHVNYIDVERHMVLGRPDEAFRLADRMFDSRRREDFEPDDGSTSLSSLWTYIEAFVAMGAAAADPQRSRDLYDRAKGEAVVGEPWLDFVLEMAHAMALLGIDDLDAALEVIENDELMASVPDGVGLHIAVLHCLDRHLDAAALLPAFDAGRALTPMSAYMEALAAVAAQFGGRTDDVDRRIEIALLFARRFDSPYFASAALMCLGAILHDRGQVESARRFLDAAAALDSGSMPILRIFREPHRRALGLGSGEPDRVDADLTDPGSLASLIDRAIGAIRPAATEPP